MAIQFILHPGQSFDKLPALAEIDGVFYNADVRSIAIEEELLTPENIEATILALQNKGAPYNLLRALQTYKAGIKLEMYYFTPLTAEPTQAENLLLPAAQLTQAAINKIYWLCASLAVTGVAPMLQLPDPAHYEGANLSTNYHFELLFFARAFVSAAPALSAWFAEQAEATLRAARASHEVFLKREAEKQAAEEAEAKEAASGGARGGHDTGAATSPASRSTNSDSTTPSPGAALRERTWSARSSGSFGDTSLPRDLPALIGKLRAYKQQPLRKMACERHCG